MDRAPVRSPAAEATPQCAGTTTVPIPKRSATRAACMGPAPPKATRAKPRGSMPRCTVTTCTADAIEAQTISCTAYAASSREPPSGEASRSRALAARSGVRGREAEER